MISIRLMRITRTDKLIISAVLISTFAIGLGGNITQHLKLVPAPLQANISYKLLESSSEAKLAWPDSGQSAIGATGYGVLATSGQQTPVATASISKLITALAVLKMKPITADKLGPTLVLSQADVDIYHKYASLGGSVISVTIGEELSEYQTIQAMLLPSANNIADSLATWAFGTLTNYADYANKMLAGYKLINTHVGTDASGFSPTTTSSASDLVLLGEIANSNPIIAEIADQSTAILPVAGTVKNVNWLLGTAGINGLKTGNSDEAGGAYLFSAEYSLTDNYKITIVGSIMKATDLKDAMIKAHSLLISSQKAFTLETPIAAGQVIATYQVPWATTVSVSANKDVTALAYQGKIIDQPVITLNGLKAPLDKNSSVGSIKTASSSTQISINLDQSISKPSLWWRLTHN